LNRHRWILALLLLLCLAAPVQAAGGQALPAIERLGVALWPEYDQPKMLVILRVTLPASTGFPAEVVLPIPASAGEPLAVAYRVQDGSLLNAPYDRQVQGEWALITLTAQSLDVQLEYYQPLSLDGAQRSFTYVWPGGQAIGSMDYEVQHPAAAEEMTIDPAPLSEAPRPDGLMYSFGDLGPVPAEETRQIRLSYSKDTPALSIDTLGPPAPPVAGPTATEGGSLDVTAWLPWALGILGLAVVAGGGMLYWRSSRVNRGIARRERHRPPRGEQESPSSSLDASVIFCHSCGTQTDVSDQFCRRCGTKLRS
jgi:hypothetical protein